MKKLSEYKLSNKLMSGLMILALICAFMTSVKNFSDNAMHNLFLTAHLNYHENDSHHDGPDHKELDDYHSHTHKHSDNGEEHTHSHLVASSVSDILQFNHYSLKIHQFKIGQSKISNSHPLNTQSVNLETFRPPIYI